MKICRAFAIIILALSPLQYSQADNNQLLVVANSDRALHRLFITQLKSQLAELNDNNVQLNVINIDHWQPEISNHHQLTLALGNKAAIKLSQHSLSRSVLFSLLPSTTYTDIVESTGNCGADLCSTIYIDQPLHRTLMLTRLALPQFKTAGFITSHDSQTNIIKLRRLAKEQGLSIVHQHIVEKDNLVFNLENILQKSDGLLSLPDAGIYSSYTVQNILLTAYRYRKPVIGYSRAFVKAGALFAVYSTPSHLSRQTAEIINQFFTKGQGKLPHPQYPRYYSVSVNTIVAKSLGIDIDSEASLQERLEASTHE